MVQIECLIIGVNFITTRKVAALHRLTVHHLCNRVLANYSISASTVAVVGVRTPPKFWTWVSDTPTFWQLHIIIQLLCLREILWGS